MKSKISLLASTAAFFILIYSASSCHKNKDQTAQLTQANQADTITSTGGTKTLNFTCDASWSIDNTGADWLHLSQTSGNSGEVTIQLTAPANTSGISRSVLLKLNSANGQSRRITVFQAPAIYPSYNTSPIAPDATGMGSTAMQLAAKIKLGWNIYNTMEAPGGETGWGNPVITQELIHLVKQSGMNAIRIPCQWDYSHIINRETEQIDPSWINRVKEVVQYCINDDMYVILNIHWDGGWLDCKATGANKDTVNAKQKALWEQIATAMRDFDEHLIFASANEPDAQDITSTFTLMGYHQTFIDAVRSTGGRNSYRTLVIQSPSTSGDLANQYLNPSNKYKTPTLPTDPTPDRMMIEFHYYGPPNFCILGDDASWGPEWYFWGANYHTTTADFLNRNATPATEEHYVDSILKTIKTNFYDKGIPAVMGEYDAVNHSGKLTGYPQDSILSVNSRDHFLRYVTQQARANGILPFVWAGGIFDRSTNTISNQQTLDSLRAGAGL